MHAVLYRNSIVRHRLQDVGLALFSLVCVALAIWLIIKGQGRAAVAMALMICFVVLAVQHPLQALFILLIYLTFLADIRRLLIYILPWSGKDPLLLIGPAAAGFLVLGALLKRRIQLDTPLARIMTMLMLVMFIQIFNPLQGGLTVGVAGALFYIAPLLWFWVGRTYLSEVFMARVFRLLAVLALLVVAVGFYQAIWEYLPHQKAWIEAGGGYSALLVGDRYRPISVFSSSAEYVQFLTIGGVIYLAYFLIYRQGIALLGYSLMIAGILLAGTRSPLVLLAFATAVMWAVRGSHFASWTVRLLGGLALVGLFLTLLLSQLEHLPLPEQVRPMIERQVSGLSDPLNEETSTAPDHIMMVIDGFRQGFTRPWGKGLGATTLAASRFGDGGASTEQDFSDMFVALGLVGGTLYLLVILYIFRNAITYWHQQRSLISLGILGIAVTTFGLWLAGSHYAASAIIWLSFGFLDRAQQLSAEGI